MDFDTSSIIFSKNDIKSELKIPNSLDNNVAEFLGVMVGDDHIGCYKKKDGKCSFTHYEIRISGNIKDLDYYSNHVNGLAEKVFNVRFNVKQQKSRNALVLSKDSKGMFYFLSKSVGIPERKDSVCIPKQIMCGSLAVKSAFLRGLADSDFTLTIKNKSGKQYPVIAGASKSEFLAKDVSQILNEFQINHCKVKEHYYYKKRDKHYVRTVVYVNGIKNVNAWFSVVGFSNQRHVRRHQDFFKKRP